MGKFRQKVKSHSIQILVALVCGAIGIPVGRSLPIPPGFERAMFEFICFVVFFILGAITAEFVSLADELSALPKIQESLRLIAQERALLHGASEPVQDVLLRYSKRFWGDMSEDPLKVHMKYYLWLLEESLEVATKTIFATSLISPKEWLSDKNYKRYLLKQQKRVKNLRSLTIQRIFIMKAEDFYKDSRVEEVIKMHIDAGIKVGLCDKSLLTDEHEIDLVMFETNGNKWVVEGGVFPAETASEDTKETINMRLHFQPTYFENKFKHWKQDIDSHVTFYETVNDYNSKKVQVGKS